MTPEPEPLSKFKMGTSVSSSSSSLPPTEPPTKRRRLSSEKDTKAKPHILIRPAPLTTPLIFQRPQDFSPIVEKDEPSMVQGKSKLTLGNKRSSAFNLRNYPSSRHPAGLAIWVLQKIDQMRKDRDDSNLVPTSENKQWPTPNGRFLQPANTYSSQNTYGWVAQNSTSQALQWPFQPNASSFAPIPLEEPGATRRQSQRERKTKQRLENWAKNKENDVVARAKLEAKKHFTSNESEAERQVWIEERIKQDYDRLLQRLAEQFKGEIAHLRPFQTGFAEIYFNDGNWPPEADSYVLSAVRILASVLPGLTETQVTERSQTAADDLISSLEKAQPAPEAFFSAISMLSENSEILDGIEKVVGYLFAAKTGPSLARKNASPVSAAPQGSHPLYWKEPATLDNSAPTTTWPAAPNVYASVPQVGSRAEQSESGRTPNPYYSSPYPFNWDPSPYRYLVPPQGSSPYFPPGHEEVKPASASLENRGENGIPHTPHYFKYPITSVQLTPSNMTKPETHAISTIAKAVNDRANLLNQQLAPTITPTDKTDMSRASTDNQSAGGTPINATRKAQDLFSVAKSPLPPMSIVSENPVQNRDKEEHPSAKIVDPAEANDGASLKENIKAVDNTSNISAITTIAEQPKTRFPTRERKPTAKAISANQTQTLLSKLVGDTKHMPPDTSFSLVNSLAPSSPDLYSRIPGSDRSQSDKAGSVSKEIMPLSPNVSNAEFPTTEMDATPTAPNSSADSETPQLRSSGRERKLTEKALAMNKVGLKKRSASPISSPPHPKVLKVSKPGSRRSSLLQFSLIPPPEGLIHVSGKEILDDNEGVEPPPIETNPTNIALPADTERDQDGSKTEREAYQTNLDFKKRTSLGRKKKVTKIYAAANSRSELPPSSSQRSLKSRIYLHVSQDPPRPLEVPADKGAIAISQQKSSILLDYARIAAEWPSSDDDGDDTPESERLFQKRLSKAFRELYRNRQKKPQLDSKALNGQEEAQDMFQNSKRTPAPVSEPSPIKSSSKSLQPVFVPPVNTILNAKESQEAYKVLLKLSSDDPELVHHEVIERTVAEPSNKASMPPVHSYTSTSSFYQAGNGPPGLVDGANVASLRWKDKGEAQDFETLGNYVSVAQARDAAKLRGISVDDNMGWQQLQSMILAHDAEIQDSLSRPSVGSNHRSSTTMMRLQMGKDAGASGHHLHQFPSIRTPVAGTRFHLPPYPHPYLSNSTPNGYTNLAPTNTNLPTQIIDLVDETPNANGHVHFNNVQNELRIARIETIEMPPNKKARTRSPSKPALTNGSRFKIDPRGINGGPPGGGTIINAKESQAAARERRKSKPALDVNGGSSRRSSPGVGMANFKKGGLLMSFGQT